MRRLLAAIALSLTLAAGAAAAPPAADPEGAVVAELVVQARTGGPPWWRVSRGGSVVWVLGVPSGLPRGTRWDQSGLASRLAGARRLIVPPAFTTGLGDIFGAVALGRRLRAPGPIEAALPADLRARYLTASAALGQPPRHYDSWKPAVSGLIMLGDFRKRAGIDDRQPLAAIRGAAGRRGVRVVPAASYRALPFLRTLTGDLTPQVNLACLADSLQEIEAGSGRVRAAAGGWTRGDVRTALTAERGFERCLASFPEFTAQVRQTMADETAAIAHDLQTPGVSVAAIPLRSLLAQDGVLARLKAQGYDVRTPAD
ncbi:MAG: TraB/GumN family protein [Caulobacterales bacterium]